jgi:hypothetical protein
VTPRQKHLPDHNERLEQARRRAQWDIGDPSWADVIVAAYCDPADDVERLEMEQAE